MAGHAVVAGALVPLRHTGRVKESTLGRVEALERGHLDRLRAAPAPCTGCLCWELDAVRHRQVHHDPGDERTRAELLVEWVRDVEESWGTCGQVLVAHDEVVGHLLYAPGHLVPGTARFATAPPSPDAVVLTHCYVAPEARGSGAGRALVRAMAADLVQRRDGAAEGPHPRAVEAFTDLRPGARCTPPHGFLVRAGFHEQRPHPSTPRMRLDLDATVRWRDEVEAALARLVEVVRPRRQPARAHTESILRLRR